MRKVGECGPKAEDQALELLTAAERGEVRRQVLLEDRLELVREAFERFAATGEFAADRPTDDFVWDMSSFHGWPEQRIYEGAEGVGAFLAGWVGAWAEWALELQELHDAGDRVVTFMYQRVRDVRCEAGRPWACFVALVDEIGPQSLGAVDGCRKRHAHAVSVPHSMQSATTRPPPDPGR